MYDLGMLLKRLRKEHGYTQARLAEIIHKSKNVISDYESNIAMPTLDTLISLAQLYHVSLDYLAGLEAQECVVIEHLTEEQKSLIKTLVSTFTDHQPVYDLKLTEKQTKVLTALINEFIIKNK